MIQIPTVIAQSRIPPVSSNGRTLSIKTCPEKPSAIRFLTFGDTPSFTPDQSVWREPVSRSDNEGFHSPGMLKAYPEYASDEVENRVSTRKTS
jgi:hypothetical protein